MGVEILVPIIALLMPVFICGIVYYFESRNKEQVHTTLQKLVDSGQELSPEILENIPGFKGKKPADRDDVRSGSIAIGVGVGLTLLGKFGLGVDVVFGVGLLMISIGLGILLYGIYSKKQKIDYHP